MLRWVYDCRNRYVFSHWWKVDSNGANVMSAGRLFQTWGPATRKAQVPIFDSLKGGTTWRLVPAERRDCRTVHSVLQYYILWYSAINGVKSSSLCVAVKRLESSQTDKSMAFNPKRRFRMCSSVSLVVFIGLNHRLKCSKEHLWWERKGKGLEKTGRRERVMGDLPLHQPLCRSVVLHCLLGLDVVKESLVWSIYNDRLEVKAIIRSCKSPSDKYKILIRRMAQDQNIRSFVLNILMVWIIYWMW